MPPAIPPASARSMRSICPAGSRSSGPRGPAFLRSGSRTPFSLRIVGDGASQSPGRSFCPDLLEYSNRVMSKDLYKILGIPQTATDKDIRAAYRTLAKKYHPDTGAGSSEDRFREIQDAYETLGSPARRADYDRKSVLSEYPTNQRAPSPRFR